MRKFTLLFSLVAMMFVTIDARSQAWCWTCDPATYGKVRIGVNAPYTTKQLYVRANGSDNVAYFENISPFGNGVIISAPEDPLRVGGLNDYTGQFFIIKRHPLIPTAANIGINKTNPSSLYSLDVAGSVQSFGFFTTSDQRAKKNIQLEMGDYLNIYKVKTYQYAYKTDQTNRSHYGVMAQEMKEFYPDMVMGSDEEGYSVNYTEMIPLLIRAVQDQKQTIESLENKLQKLTDKINENTELADLLGTDEERMTIFPNPSSNSTNVTLKGSSFGSVSLELVNLNGEVVQRIAASTGKTSEIDTSQLLKGVYFVRYLKDGKVLETKRLLIEK